MIFTKSVMKAVTEVHYIAAVCDFYILNLEGKI